MDLEEIAMIVNVNFIQLPAGRQSISVIFAPLR